MSPTNTSMSSQVELVTKCQLCEGSIEFVMALGSLPPVNDMVPTGKRLASVNVFPLDLLRCTDCGLVQIGAEISSEILFPESYPYLSGTTKILRDNFQNLCDESSEQLKLSKDAFIIDIGSNDGTLLSPFVDAGYNVLGIEPSQAADVANSRNINTRKAYFNDETVSSVLAERGKANLVTAANVFAHIADVHKITSLIASLLKDDGVFISESHYLGDLIETLQYDTIYHEHLRYYSLTSLQKLFSSHDLEIFDVKRIPTHGGSIRVYTARKGLHEIQPSVMALLKQERESGVADGSALADFKARAIKSKLDLLSLLVELKQAGNRIYGIGAPSRASTLINFVGLRDDVIDAVMEVTGSHKIGFDMPGTNIPVLDEAILYEQQPEYVVLLSWHIADALIRNLKKSGYKGKFIVPLPEVHVVS